jgi:arginase
MKTKSIQIIAVPYHLDKERVGMGRGPEAYLNAGVVEQLRSAGNEVESEILLLKNEFNNEKKFLLALNQRIAEKVRQMASKNLFPFILSGNCNATIGAISALNPDEAGLIWFDAHGDFNTPDTSPSGFFDGMGMAVIAGLCYEEFAKTLGGCLPMPAARMLHVGGRDFDAGELDNFQKAGVGLIPAVQIQKTGASDALKPFLDKLGEKTRSVHLHLDIDVLNSQDYPANEFPAPGGLSLEELEPAIDVIGQNFSIRSATLSAYNPAYDPKGKTLQAGMRLMRRIAGKQI